ncbi:unnamed protein product [Phaedon cochleariae]|uniref:DUF7869 domain-containing protein n=1 Tax=Phaedon cochleariae TaxID=80249 RepID=A0A9N9SAM8_PHACE|nr:unnamed protein product [Phaedon cochleariae]
MEPDKDTYKIKCNGNTLSPKDYHQDDINPSCRYCPQNRNEFNTTLKNLLTDLRDITRKQTLSMSVATETIDQIKKISDELKKLRIENIPPDCTLHSKYKFSISDRETFDKLEEYLTDFQQFGSAVSTNIMSSRSRDILNRALRISGLETDDEQTTHSKNDSIQQINHTTKKENTNTMHNNVVYEILGETVTTGDENVETFNGKVIYEILGDTIVSRCGDIPNVVAENTASSDGMIDIQSCVIMTDDGIMLDDGFPNRMVESVNFQFGEQTVQHATHPNFDETNKTSTHSVEPANENIIETNEIYDNESSNHVNSLCIPETVNSGCDENLDSNLPSSDEPMNIEQESDNDNDTMNDITYVPTADEMNEIDEEHMNASSSDENNEVQKKQVENDTRMRRRNSSQWKKSVAKMEKNLGNEYQNRTGKIFPKKNVKFTDCSKCKLKCNSKINLQDLKNIHESYWKTGSYERQRDFICKHVKISSVVRRRKDTNSTNSRRNNTYRYYFPGDNQVCKKTFLRCLNISDKTVRLAKMKEMGGSSMVSKDMRGKHSPKNKTSDARRTVVKKHIESFPVMESHYCRSKTKRKYISSELNITKMYELYVEKCDEENVLDPVSSAVYRKIFCSEYNLGFHRPKKDSCATCEKYKQVENEKKQEMKEEYDRHIKNKEVARKKKESDKKRSETDISFKSVTFDLQSVLYTPCSEVSHYYYALKFCSYNLCVYDQASKDGFSYFWTETDGKRGSDEIGTALFMYFKSLPESVKHVSLYSDSCGGQNRNRFIASLLLYVVRVFPIEVITQNFLETGHTDMEVDSMHSAIECNKKHQRIYTPHEWSIIIRTAQRKQPYNVQELSYTDILDLKALKSSLTSQKMSEDQEGNIINWMNIKELQFRKTCPQTIFVKDDHSQENYSEMPIVPPKTKRKIHSEPELKKKYNKPIPISEKKKKSLVNLCRVDAMPAMYHNFYRCLPSSSNVIDRVPEPDHEDT